MGLSVARKEGAKAAPEHLGRVCVLGLGKSGKAAARYCSALLGDRVDSLFIAAGERSDDSQVFLSSMAESGVSWAFGSDALEGEQEGFDLCIASPGIPYWHDLYAAGLRLSSEVVGEVEFAWRESDADSRWIAITGTNGKTTTTALSAHVLRECGLPAAAVGNIGDVCLDAVAAGNTGVYVAEVSSYQLASTVDFAPDVAVLLNITPDHIHWHRTFEAYRDAKFKLLGHLAPCNPADRGGIAVLDATNDVVRAKVRELKSVSAEAGGISYIPMGTSEGIFGDMRKRCGSRNAAFVDGAGNLRVAFDGVEHALCASSDLQIKGEHNVSNALAAAAVAIALNAGDDGAISRALSGFAPLEHRIEPCGEVGGVACYNDSKATNVDATLKALDAFRGSRLIVLLGGDDKGTDLDALVQAVYGIARAAVCYGEAGGRFAAALGDGPDGFTLARADHLGDAFDTALGLADTGDVVLLSPACASFDEFSSFEERGGEFKRLVALRSRELEGDGE